jgi:hypothetical protein
VTTLRRTGAALGLTFSLCLGATALPAASATLQLSPGQSLADALRRAAEGDVIELAAGDYRGQVGVIEQRRLTLRGAGGRAVLRADGRHAEGKATLVVRNGDVLIENIDFRGSRVPDGNGAGIRFERGRLTVVNCAFFDNQNGILTSNAGDAELVVRDSEFGQAPRGAQLPHLLYVGRIARFTLSGSRFSGGAMGHLVKSRASVSEVRNNQLVDGPGGQAAYELEFPNGGMATVVGNTIRQSAGTSNPALVSYGAEGYGPGPHSLVFTDNTLVNEAGRTAVFVRVNAAPSTVALRVQGNSLYGLGDPGAALPADANPQRPLSALPAMPALPAQRP